MNKLLARIIFGLWSAWAAGTAFGQAYQSFDAEWSRVTEAARFHLGSISLFPTFGLKNFGYVDNAYFEDHPIKDFTAGISPSLEAAWPIRHRLILYVRENPEYVFFLKEKQQRTLTNSYAAGARLKLLNRVVLFGEYGHVDRQQAVSSELLRPARLLQTTGQAGMFYETGRRTSIGITAAVSRLSYRDIELPDGTIALAPVLNRTEKSFAVEGYYHIRNDVVFFTKADYAIFEFADTAFGRDSSATQVLAGLRFPLAGRIVGTLSLGFKRMTPRAAGKDSFAGLVGNTSLEWRSGRFGLRAAYQRDVTFSYLENAYFFIQNGYGAGASAYLTDFLRMDYNINFGVLDYPGAQNVLPAGDAVASFPRRDRQVSHAAGIVVRIFKTAGVGAMFNLERWTSTLPGLDRDRRFFEIYATSRF